MTMVKKSFWLMAVGVVVFGLVVWTGRERGAVKLGPVGTLEAKVRFVGASCGPGTGTTPPCDGMYSGYLVRIYGKSGKLVLEKVANEEGVVNVDLVEGEYFWKQNEPLGRGQTAFRVVGGRKTEVELVVDSGIR